MEKLPSNAYTPGIIRIATRGSTLALWQANYLKSLIEKTGTKVSIVVIKTTGDRVQNRFLSEIGGKGLFTKELEESLLARETDVAIHSLKDVPTNLSKPFTLGAILPRHSPSDILIANPKKNLLGVKGEMKSLDANAVKGFAPNITIATGSLRRIALLKNTRGNVQTLAIRGNVDTRLKKLEDSPWAGIILAKASVDRLGITGYPMWELDPNWFTPAPGQGALALEVLTENHELREWLSGFSCPETHRAITIERNLLQAVGGDCTLPFGSWVRDDQTAESPSTHYQVSAFISDESGHEISVTKSYEKSVADSQITSGIMMILKEKGLEKILSNLKVSP